MSNERIDLTQFEGITSKIWRLEGSWWGKTGGDMTRWIVRGDFLENDANVALACAAPVLLAELKRMYEREDALVSAIKELYYSEDNTGCSEDLTVVSLVAVLKLRDLTSE